ncbi:hypothetical protein [Roseateles saccharophilus]|uniref:Uncharacterized protein n=1 Tax=Roseateles saccharophilus TaxID=304 RepID=A0A4R3V4W1_ROSSA|nr:hypothetical protein [Roseateles saccharophilus]MDG0831525.1 hypothetical protein [Roseateles saccharophilus]TCU98591.1 hypothetical protein EV671_101040 [Roseateles saccharophilus]
MSTDTSLGTTKNPYPVTLTAGFDGNNQPYFLYFDPQGKPMSSPLVIPAAKPSYDSIRFTQTGDATQLRLWAAVTHTLDNSSPVPQGDNLLLALGGSVAITVNLGTWRGTVLIFVQLDAAGNVVKLVPTPDPTTENDG